MSHTSYDNRQNAEADKPVISPEHTGKFYGQLLTILDRTKNNILNVMGDTFKETVSQADKAESYNVSKLLNQPYDETRLAYAIWNLINIFYSTTSIYKAGEKPSTYKTLGFYASFTHQSLNLANNMLLMVSPSPTLFSSILELPTNKNHQEFKQGIRINNDKIFELGVIVTNLLIEINPTNYPSPTQEPNMTELFKRIKQSKGWFERMESLPSTTLANLKAYFLCLSKTQQTTLLNKLPNYSLASCVKANTFETSMPKKTVTTKEASSSPEGKETHPLSTIVTTNNQSPSNTVKLKKRKKKKLVNSNPISELSLKWKPLHTEYFADTYDPKSRFHGCVDGYANSVYTIFETLLAYLWLKAGYAYGKTRQQRRTDVMTALSEKSNAIFVLLKEYDRLSNPNSSELVKTATARHLFFSSETTRGSQQYIINQLTAEWDTLSRCIETAKPQFTGHFHDKILDCLDDLDNAVKRLRHEITKEMPTLKQDNDDDYDVQVVANCDW